MSDIPICACEQFYGGKDHHPECPVLTLIAKLEAYKEKYPPEYVDDLQHRIDVLQIEVDTLRPPFEEWMREAGLGIAQKEMEKQKARIAKLEAALEEIRDSEFCDYESQPATGYGTGVVDGHRFCSNITRKALEEGK